jgi:mRNA interferase MazF
MTRQAVIPLLRKITAVPATQRVHGIPSEVPLDEEDEMPAARVLNFDSMAVMPKGWFVEPICQLPPVRMVQACRALSVALGC